VDRYDLRARLEAATISWRYSAKPRGISSAKAAHTRLLAKICTFDRKGSQYQLSPADIRKVIVELREIALAHAKGASEALLALVEADCRFEYEQESMDGERHQVGLRIHDIPFLDNACTALSVVGSFADLPQAQQANLVRYQDEEKAVRHLEVRVQIERAEGTRVAQVERSLKLAAARAALDRTRAAISPLGQKWWEQHREAINLLGWSDLSLPILGTARFDSEQLLQASETLSRISDCLTMPFPLDPGAESDLRRRWLKLWRICEDAAENLSMASAWFRCLGSTGEYKRCRVCFRHVGEGMKKNCWLHHRTAKARVPSRELHVSDLYHGEWRQAAKRQPEIRKLLDDASPTKTVQTLMMQAAERERLVPEVKVAAAILASQLRMLVPLMEPRLQAHVKQQFDTSVSEANRRIMARRDINGQASFTPPGQALGMLSWERFFGSFFASEMLTSEATVFAAGKLIDIDHPLASTKQAITVQKLALDLLHLSVWISVDLTFDAYSYLDIEAIRYELEQADRKGMARPTYQDLAAIHHTTPQAIHQALSRRSSSTRKYRVLEKGRKKLQRMLMKRRT
jgi:hypothetical protein